MEQAECTVPKGMFPLVSTGEDLKIKVDQAYRDDRATFLHIQIPGSTDPASFQVVFLMHDALDSGEYRGHVYGHTDTRISVSFNGDGEGFIKIT
jgi:hypothetical protein